MENELCECCQFETTELSEYSPPTNSVRKAKYKFCDICAATPLSNIIMYSHLSEYRPLAQAIGYIGNLILAEIKKNKPS